MDLSLLSGDRPAALADGTVPDDADARLRAERHQHEHAGRNLDIGRQPIVVGLVQRHGQQHRHPITPCSGTRPAFFETFEQTLQSFNPATGTRESNQPRPRFFIGGGR